MLDHRDRLFCLFELKKKLPWPFSLGINIMSLAVWLGEDRECSAVVVGLDLLLGLLITRNTRISFRKAHL